MCFKVCGLVRIRTTVTHQDKWWWIAMYFYQTAHQKLTKPYTMSPIRPTVSSFVYREPVGHRISTVITGLWTLKKIVIVMFLLTKKYLNGRDWILFLFRILYVSVMKSAFHVLSYSLYIWTHTHTRTHARARLPVSAYIRCMCICLTRIYSSIICDSI